MHRTSEACTLERAGQPSTVCRPHCPMVAAAFFKQGPATRSWQVSNAHVVAPASRGSCWVHQQRALCMHFWRACCSPRPVGRWKHRDEATLHREPDQEARDPHARRHLQPRRPSWRGRPWPCPLSDPPALHAKSHAGQRNGFRWCQLRGASDRCGLEGHPTSMDVSADQRCGGPLRSPAAATAGPSRSKMHHRPRISPLLNEIPQSRLCQTVAA